jgi:predicted membrane protein
MTLQRKGRDMRTAATILGFLIICLGFVAFAWLFPLFTLNEPYLTWYIESVLQADAKPGGSGAALPFVWIVTAPIGVALMAVGMPIIYWGQRKERDAND